MDKRNVKVEKTEEEVIEDFYKKFRKVVQGLEDVSESKLDMKTYRELLNFTKKTPDEYMNIFLSLPKWAKKNILKSMGMRTEEQFRVKFFTHINKYYHNINHPEEEEKE